MAKSAKYDRIGDNYDRSRRADPRIADRLERHLTARGRRRKARYLDVACGTGNYTALLTERGLDMTGLDASPRMLNTAAAKSRDVAWVQGIAERLPFADGVFTSAMISLAIHHFDDLEAAFAEIYRTLGKGNLVIFTATAAQTRGYWLNQYFPRALAEAAEVLPSMETVSTALDAAGFNAPKHELFEVPPDLRDHFLYAGKHRPGLYLDPRMRAGISMFREYADQNEIERGLGMLANDIESGRIREIMSGYRNRRGDYLFVIASK